MLTNITTNFKSAVQSIDYSYNNIKTYAVFVPVLSLVIQKIQTSDLIPSTMFDHGGTLSSKTFGKNDYGHHIQKICRWHLLGATTQMIALTAALVFTNPPTLTLIALSCLSIYQFGSITYAGFVKVKLMMNPEENIFIRANGFF